MHFLGNKLFNTDNDSGSIGTFSKFSSPLCRYLKSELHWVSELGRVLFNAETLRKNLYTPDKPNASLWIAQ